MKTRIIELGFQQLTTDYTDNTDYRPSTVDRQRPDCIREIRGMAFKSFCAPIYLACLLTFLPALAFAEDAGQQPIDNETRFEAIANRLNLTAEQKEKIHALRQAQRQQMKALFQELQAKRQQLQAELNNPSATRESIAPLVAEIKEIQAKMVDLRINNIFTVKEALHSDQLNKLQQFRQQRTGNEKDRCPFGLEKRRFNKEERNQEK